MFSLFRKRTDDPAEAAREPEVPAAAEPIRPAAGGEPAPAAPEVPSGPADVPEPAAAAAEAGFNFDALTAPAPPTDSGPKIETGPEDGARTAELTPPIVEALKTVYDPEIPVNIYDLGLIYGIAVDGASRAHITMTLTSPACPSAQQLPVEVEWKVRDVPGIDGARVDVVWDPPWTKERMSEDARLALGLF